MVPVSVMIPTYNSSGKLNELLQSLPVGLLAQVAVVDDASTDATPIIMEPWTKRGVEYYRHDDNVGCTRNFNRCINHAKAELVHILHADDQIHMGYYGSLDYMTKKYPGLALYATSHIKAIQTPKGLHLDFQSHLDALSQPTRDTSSIHYVNFIGASCVTMRRDFYMKHGGFDKDLIHAADWEMWVRAVSRVGGMVMPAAFIVYNIHDANHTSQLMQTGENLREQMRVLPRFRSLPNFDEAHFMEIRRRGAQSQIDLFVARGDERAAEVNRQVYAELFS
jgi:glycosyltransferase involved in cell wall biosynthesis